MPGGLRLNNLPLHSPELQPADTLRTPMDEPVVNKPIPDLDTLVNIIGTRCCGLTECRSGIGSRTDFAW